HTGSERRAVEGALEGGRLGARELEGGLAQRGRPCPTARNRRDGRRRVDQERADVRPVAPDGPYSRPQVEPPGAVVQRVAGRRRRLAPGSPCVLGVGLWAV